MLASWAILAYIGVINSIVDVWLGATQWLFVDKPVRTKGLEFAPATVSLDWRAVLYHGQVGSSLPKIPADDGSANQSSAPTKQVPA